MQIRSFQLSDYRSVAELWQEVLSEECCEETMGAFARQLSWDSELVLVAETEAGIVGALIGTIDHHNGYMYRIAVYPEYRGQGVGRALIQSLNNRFKQRNVMKVLIAGDKHNEILKPFYEALGVSLKDFTSIAHPLSIVAG